MLMPVMVIAFEVPTAFVAYVPLMPEVLMVTESPETTPLSCAALVSICDVALVVESYTREVVVTPLTVSVFAVTSMVTVALSGSYAGFVGVKDTDNVWVPLVRRVPVPGV